MLRKAALPGSFLAVLALAILPPWIFVRSLTHPGCQPPAPLPNLPPAEEHLLKTADGLLLRAWYYPAQNHAAILALGGNRGSLGSALPPIEALVQAGFGVLQIDSRACARPPAPVTLGFREALDAQAGYSFLHSRSEIDSQRIGAFGFSMGGAAVVRCAARQPEIAAVVFEGGYSNLSRNFDTYGAGGAFTRLTGALSALAFIAQTGVNPAHSRPVDELSAISPRPLLLIYGEAEVGEASAALWEAARPPKELWIVPGGSHGKNHGVAPIEYERRVVEFFARVLLPQPTEESNSR